MSRIAHISDLHLLESAHRQRSGQALWRLQYLSAKRRLDPENRRQRALAAMISARSADHLVITGDLTEDAHTAQFELVAELLAESGWAPECVTLVPGNHDAYGPDAWARALAGPLRNYAPSSTPGGRIELPDAVLVPLITAVEQFWARSSGKLDLSHLADMNELVALAAGRAIVLLMHHPPYKVMGHWVHGLLNRVDIRDLLLAHPEIHLLHGHIHRHRDHAIGEGLPRVFSVEAVVTSDRPVRFYDVVDGRLVPAEVPVIAAA